MITLNSTSSYKINDRSNTVAALMMAGNSCLGIFLNLTFMINFFSDKKQRSSFNVVCAVRAFNNIFILLVAFLGIFLVTTILGHNYLSPIVETLLISISLNCNIHNEVKGVFMAGNRFFAMYFPSKYSKVFSVKLTCLSHCIILSIQVYQVVNRIIQRYRNQTYMVFHPDRLAYGGLIDSADEMFLWAIGYTLVPFTLNIPTFCKCYFVRKRISRDMSESGVQMRRDVSQFFQTVFQDSIWPISAVFNMKLSLLMDDKMWKFFCQTFIWQCLHVSDGFIMVMYNERLTMYRRALIAKISPGNSIERYRNPNAVAPRLPNSIT